jgi:hypothetical protein
VKITRLLMIFILLKVLTMAPDRNNHGII